MSYQIDVSFQGISGMTPAGPVRVPPMEFTLELDTQSLKGSVPGFREYIWRLLKPLPQGYRMVVGDQAQGTWKQNSVGFFLYPDSGGSTPIMELHQVGLNNASGPAFALPTAGKVGGTMYQMRGQWCASAKPLPKTWVGIMGKGSGGAGIGAEGGVGALVALEWSHAGVGFAYGAGRVIAGGGFSGGLALVIATGFKDANAFEGYASNGWDWALSFGPNLKGIVLSGKLARLVPLLRAMGRVSPNSVVSQVEAYSQALKAGEYSKEIYGAAKGALQGILIDSDYQNVTAIDIPLAGTGAEAGVYYAWSKYTVLSRW